MVSRGGWRGNRAALAVAVVAVTAAIFASPVSSADDLSVSANPTWSPDGTQVAFAYSSPSAFRIVTTPASHGGPIHTGYSVKSVNGCCDPLLWSHSGLILFVTNFTLMALSPNGGRPSTVAKNVSSFILSPNGETAAFDGTGGHSPPSIGLVDINGGRVRLVPRPAQAGDAVAGFSPDGTELVFSREATFETSPATTMVEHVGGGTPVPLRMSGLIGASRLPAGSIHPEWSPDGRWIAYIHLVRKNDDSELEVVSTSGAAAPRTVAGWTAGGFSWSPNSKLIACFCGPTNEHERLMTINPQGTRHTILWANRSLHYITEDSANLPQWSPDGSKLAFLARVGPGYPAIEVWAVGADGTGLKRIA